MENQNFLPNKQNKYAIRKYTVGTASILLGSILLMGHHEEVKAAESTPTSTPDTSSTSQNTSSNTTSSPSTIASPTTNTTETPKTATATTPNSTSNATTSTSTSETSPSTNTSTSESSTSTNPTAVKDTTTSSDQSTQPTTPQSKPSTDSQTSTSSNTTSTDNKTTTNSNTTSTANKTAPTSTSESTSQASTSDLQSTANSTSTSAATKTTVSSTVDNTAPLSAVTPNSTTGITSSVQSKPTNTVTAQGANPATVSNTNTDNTSLYALLKESSDNKDANTVTTTSETTPTLRSISTSAQPTRISRATATGTNVNDLVTVSNASISQDAIDPNQSGNFRLKADYAVNGKVKSGDYFTLQMPTYANVDGELDYSADNNQFPIDLYSPSVYVVANGVYDTTTKTLTYTFTDWVNDKENISGSFDLSQFADRTTAQKAGTYTLNYNLAGETYTTPITYNYDRHDYGLDPASVDSLITSVDATGKTNDFSEVVYVNPQDKNLSSAQLILAPKDANSNAIIDLNTTNLHIYKVPDPSQLTDSYDFNAAEYQDLAQNFYQNGSIYTNANGQLEINFGAIDGPYVVVMDSKFDPTLGSELTTRATLNATDYYGKSSSFYFDNGFTVETSTGSGDGTAQTYRLGDYVWEDANQNGVQDAGETPIPNVVVTLKDSQGTILDTAVTDEYGNYLFSGLPNGDYTVEFVTPDGYTPTVVNAGGNDATDSDGGTVPVTINGADNLTIDSGFYKPAPEPTPVPAKYNLGDYVWNDSNHDGIQNSNEVGIEGVVVTLTKPDGSIVTTTTNASGKYVFNDLENGDYTVTFTTPDGFEPTLTNVGDNRLDSNGITTTASINNADNMTVDSGFFKPTINPTPVPAKYNLGDYVWNDSNHDGIQNSNEVGIEGVVVTLTKPDGSIVTTTTDASGKYVFNDLENGDYTVTFTTPDGFEPTLTNVGDNRLDSNGITTTASINNADNMTVDSGFYQPTPEPNPNPTPEPTPEPKPNPTPEPKPNPTPEPNPNPTPEPNPNPTPEPNPNPTPEPKPNPTPEPNPNPTPEPNPNPAPEPNPNPTPGSTSVHTTSKQPTPMPTHASTISSSQEKSGKSNALPDTGKETTHTGIIGTLFAALGTLFIFGRRKRSNIK
ncbi:hypothetical protein BU591_11075 [Staphylococcus agnetis]|nr:SdrD B-like domain-containing protein [Staphylococcus agnetis]PTH13295.1 hypothetical protein BU591_11075 [Staphylococcus agnetis]